MNAEAKRLMAQAVAALALSADEADHELAQEIIALLKPQQLAPQVEESRRTRGGSLRETFAGRTGNPLSFKDNAERLAWLRDGSAPPTLPARVTEARPGRGANGAVVPPRFHNRADRLAWLRG